MTARMHALSNGVRVICDPMPGLESAALSVVFRGGCRWEDETNAGWSHLLEHMVFKGAGERSARDIVEVIEAGGGNINAATGYERTSFQVRCLSDGLPLAFEVLSDLVRRPTLDADELEREKGVIAQEIAEASDAPDDRVFDLAQTEAFREQPLGRPILGSVESLKPATVSALSAFHRRLYAPERMVVSAAGQVDEDQILALAERWFGDAVPTRDSREPVAAAFAGGNRFEARPLEQAHLVMLVPGVGSRDDDYFAQRLFAEILGGGMASRLFQEVREKHGLAYAIDAYGETYEDVGLIGIYAGADAGDAVKTARLSGEILADFAWSGPTEAELSRAKAQARAQLFMARESPLNRAEQAAGQALLFGHLFSPKVLAASVDAVTAEDIKRVGARALTGAATAVLGSKKAAKAAESFQATKH
jgi:predicted Zn-dependent peptidase